MNQSERVLVLFCQLLRGKYISKMSYTMEFQITERSFARDIQCIRRVLSEIHLPIELRLDRLSGCYYLSDTCLSYLNGMDVLVLIRMLLGTRALRKDEMKHLIQTISSFLSRTDREQILKSTDDAIRMYISPKHNTAIVKMQWDLTRCIEKRCSIRLCYKTSKREIIYRDVLPIEIIFSNRYFYLLADLLEEQTELYSSFPTFFRIDRICSFQILQDKTNHRLYNNAAFHYPAIFPCTMCSGEKLEVTLWCRRDAMEEVFDSVPTYKIVRYTDDGVILKISVWGEGFLSWIIMQGIRVKILSPEILQEKLIKALKNSLKLYA